MLFFLIKYNLQKLVGHLISAAVWVGRIAWWDDGLVELCMVVLELHGVAAWVFCAACINKRNKLNNQIVVKFRQSNTLTYCNAISYFEGRSYVPDN